MQLALAVRSCGIRLEGGAGGLSGRFGPLSREPGHRIRRTPWTIPTRRAPWREALTQGRAERGIVVCGSGAGVSIAANKIPGIRAAVCHDTYTAHQAVEHDDMNVLCLGARVVGAALAMEIVVGVPGRALLRRGPAPAPARQVAGDRARVQRPAAVPACRPARRSRLAGAPRVDAASARGPAAPGLPRLRRSGRTSAPPSPHAAGFSRSAKRQKRLPPHLVGGPAFHAFANQRIPLGQKRHAFVVGSRRHH